HHLQGLKRHHDLVVLAVIADQHQDLFAHGHLLFEEVMDAEFYFSISLAQWLRISAIKPSASFSPNASTRCSTHRSTCSSEGNILRIALVPDAAETAIAVPRTAAAPNPVPS